MRFIDTIKYMLDNNPMLNKKTENIVVGSIQTNCWIHPFGGETCAVIDPGGDADIIISRLEELKLIPVYILFTHGHFDHLFALPELLGAFSGGSFASYPAPKIGIHRLDAGYLGKDSRQIHNNSIKAAGGSHEYIDELWNSLPSSQLPGADLLFEEGSTAGTLKVIHLPGHSQGSVAFYDEEQEILYSGDTLFRGTWGRTDLPGGSESLIQKSLRRLLSMNGGIVVCPGHGPATEIGKEQNLIGN